MTEGIAREELQDGAIRLIHSACTFTFRRMRPGALRITITGHDKGQLGTRPLDEVRLEMLRHRPLELFIDASEAVGATAKVSREWTQFFALNRGQLKRVDVLVGSKALHLTVSIAQHLSRTGNLIQIHSDRRTFDRQLVTSGPASPAM